MTKHLRVFQSLDQYDEWVNDDNWLPHACFVPDSSTEREDIGINTPGRVYFSRIGDCFLQVANGGTLYVTDNENERGYLDGDTLVLESPYISTDEESGTIVYNSND